MHELLEYGTLHTVFVSNLLSTNKVLSTSWIKTPDTKTSLPVQKRISRANTVRCLKEWPDEKPIGTIQKSLLAIH